MAGRKILFMGSELTRFFLDSTVMDWAGLEVKSPLFPRSVKFVMISPNPAFARHQPLGELRLSIEKFVAKLKED
jgi:hypothetical protein